jgi:rRNA maturation protein Nop10
LPGLRRCYPQGRDTMSEELPVCAGVKEVARG